MSDRNSELSDQEIGLQYMASVAVVAEALDGITRPNVDRMTAATALLARLAGKKYLLYHMDELEDLLQKPTNPKE